MKQNEIHDIMHIISAFYEKLDSFCEKFIDMDNALNRELTHQINSDCWDMRCRVFEKLLEKCEKDPWEV